LGCFSNNKSRFDGLEAYCRSCNVVKSRKWRAENPERMRQIAYKSFAKYPERCFARRRAGYLYPEIHTCTAMGCGELAERHHPDYEKPDEIIWLCKKHHRLLDGKKRGLAIMV